MAKRRSGAGKKGGVGSRDLAIFARTVGTLQMCGVPILDSMAMVAETTENEAMARAVLKARANLREGEGITPSMKDAGCFPPMFIQMIGAGEETGKLDDMLMKLGDFYMAEAEGRSLDEVAALTHQLALAVSAGLPLVQALGIIAENVGGTVGQTLEEVRNAVARGDTFAQALARHPRTFDTTFVAMVKTGEIGGNLDVVLQRLADLLEFRARGRKR